MFCTHLFSSPDFPKFYLFTCLMDQHSSRLLLQGQDYVLRVLGKFCSGGSVNRVFWEPRASTSPTLGDLKGFSDVMLQLRPEG